LRRVAHINQCSVNCCLLYFVEARQKVDEAEAYLERVKKGGSPKGALWWMERELHEARAFLPKSKGGYNKREINQS